MVMELWSDKPLSFKELLKLTFNIFKSNFLKFFLIVLILTGPLYIFITLIYRGFSIFGITFGSLDTTDGFFYMTYVNTILASLSSLELGLLIFGIIIFLLVAIPLAIASIIIQLGSLKKGENIALGQTIKRAFSKYWALFRGGFTYFIIPVLLLIFLGFVPFLMARIEGPSMWIRSITLITIILTPLLIYILTRMSLYFAFIIFEKNIIGIWKSWELLKGKNTIKLIGLYFFIFAIDVILILFFNWIFGLAFGGSIISILLEKIVFMILLPLNVVYYTVIFFDFLNRKELSISE